jgi:hypothetical protein
LKNTHSEKQDKMSHSSQLELNWVPVAFSAETVRLHCWRNGSKDDLIERKDEIGQFRDVDLKQYKEVCVQDKGEPEDMAGVFFFGALRNLNANLDKVLLCIEEAKNHQLVKQCILRALERSFTKSEDYDFTRGYFQSNIIMPSSEVRITPEFSVFERIRLKPYYFSGAPGQPPTYGLVLNPSHQYIFDISTQELYIFKDCLVNASADEGHVKGKLRELDGGEAVLEKNRNGSARVNVRAKGVQPVGSISNFNKLCKEKYQDRSAELMRNLREASGAATKDSPINENRLHDKYHRVREFANMVSGKFGSFKVYQNSETVFSIGQGFLSVGNSSDGPASGGRLSKRKFEFGEDSATSDVGQYQGVKNKGVVKEADVGDGLEFLFVFPEGENSLANKLYFALKNGVGPFPGIESFFNIPLSVDNVRSIEVPTDPQEGWEAVSTAYYKELNGKLEQLSPDSRKRLAFLIAPESQPSDSPNPHYVSKALLLKHGIPSQGVDQQTIANEGTLKWSAANIALATFAKLGGVPWEVESASDGHQLIFGVGKKNMFDRESNKLKKIVGYTVCVTDGGRFKSSTTCKPFNSWDDFNKEFPAYLEKAIRENVDDDTEEIVIHFPQKMGKTLAGKVEDVIGRVSDKVGKYYPHATVRVTDKHSYYLWDASHKTYLPQEGNYAELGHDDALLMVPGRQSRRSILTVPGQPLRLTLEHSSLPSTSFRKVLRQAYALAGANWHAFNAREMPITREYSELIAEELGNMDEYDIDFYEGLEQLSEVPWFL